MVDMGTGLTLHFPHYGRAKFFVDARFVQLYTTQSQVPGHNAQLVPVTFGIRW